MQGLSPAPAPATYRRGHARFIAVLFGLASASASLSLAPAAGASLSISPKAPTPTSAITVTWVPKRTYPAGKIRVVITTAATTGRGCSTRASVRIRKPVIKGRAIRVTLRPRPQWCGTGPLTVGITTTRDGRGPEGLSDIRFKGVLGTPAKVSLLDGSSLTVQVPGRADRRISAAGVLRGYVPYKIELNTPIGIVLKVLDLRLDAAADPLCPSVPERLAPQSDGRLTLNQDGTAELTLPLAVSSASLIGCAGPGTPPTVLKLTGKSGTGGLSRLALFGTLPGVALADGTTANVAVALTVMVDLSGNV